MHVSLAYFFWRGDIQGLVQLFLSLIAMGTLQAGVALAAMFGMYKLYPDKFPETIYGEFDFNHFQEPLFLRLIFRLLIIFGGTTLALHLLEYLVIYREIIRHWRLITFVMFVLETGALTAGLYYGLTIVKHRLYVITAASALAYLIFFALLRRWDLLI
jgi:hypothetical protein